MWKRVCMAACLALLSSVSWASCQSPGAFSGNPEKAAMASQVEATGDSSNALVLCAAAVTAGGMSPSGVLSGVCGCKEAVRKSCAFDWDDGDLEISLKSGAGDLVTLPMCVTFKVIAGG